MKNIRGIVIVSTLFLFFFAITPQLDFSFRVIFSLFLIGNSLLLYLVYAVLKFGIAPNKTFNEGYWYSDVDKKYSKDS